MDLGYAGLINRDTNVEKSKGLISETASGPLFNEITHKLEGLSNDEKKIQTKLMALMLP